MSRPQNKFRGFSKSGGKPGGKGPKRFEDRPGRPGKSGPFAKTAGKGAPKAKRADGRPGAKSGGKPPFKPGFKPGGRPGGFRPNQPRPGEGYRPDARPTIESLDFLLKRSGISLEKRALNQLWSFHNLLRARNFDRDLTRLIGFETIVTKHYIDCMLVGQMHQLASPILDIGTGAGFPGIPLKIQNPNLEITLAEPRPRRVEFLNEAIQKVGLKGAKVFEHKVVSQSFSTPVNAVITRALETIDKTIMRTSACLVKGGELVLMKGPSVDEELAAALKRFKNIFRLKKDRAYSLPFTSHERRLIVLEKIAEPLIPEQAAPEELEENLEGIDETPNELGE